MKKTYQMAMDRIHAGETLLSRTEAMVKANGRARETGLWRRMRFVARPLAMTVVSLLVIVLMTFAGHAWYMTPVAYLNLDINPGLEVSLNRMDHVIAVRGVNEEGKAIAQGLQVRGMELDEVVQALVQSAVEQGHMENEDNFIALTAVTDDEDQAEKISSKARKGADKALASTEHEAEVVTDAVGLARVERARALLQEKGIDITPGKLNLVEKLQAQYIEHGEFFSPEDWYAEPVKDIMAKSKEFRMLGKSEESEEGEEAGTVPPGLAKKEENSNKPDAPRGLAKKVNGKLPPGQDNSDQKREEDALDTQQDAAEKALEDIEVDLPDEDDEEQDERDQEEKESAGQQGDGNGPPENAGDNGVANPGAENGNSGTGGNNGND